MNMKLLVPLAIFAAGLAGFTQEASAKSGRNSAALGGAAAGVVAGAAGAYLLGKAMNRPAQAAPMGETTGSVRPARYEQDDEEECRVRPVKLYDSEGTYVKTERLRRCK